VDLLSRGSYVRRRSGPAGGEEPARRAGREAAGVEAVTLLTGVGL